jgi:hypothetical protein
LLCRSARPLQHSPSVHASCTYRPRFPSDLPPFSSPEIAFCKKNLRVRSTVVTERPRRGEDFCHPGGR